jgi:hypothetical protein
MDAMKGRSTLARIDWIPQNEVPGPTVQRYISPSRFIADKFMWSLVMDFPDFPDVSTASISFLADQAPHHLIRPGEKFEVYQGHKVVGRGVVIGDAT